jgi:hypothetical protein
MNYAEFQEYWEREAGAEYRRYVDRPAAALLDDVRAGRWGEYYQLWPAVAAKASLREAGPPLLDIVRSEAPYLVRYHAAAALLGLLGSRRFVAANLAADSPRREEWLDAVERALAERLAPGSE